MAQPDHASFEQQPPISTASSQAQLDQFGNPPKDQNGCHGGSPGETMPSEDLDADDPMKRHLRGRTSRQVITGVQRAQTFKRQQSEQRSHLAPVEPTLEERRAVSVDRRSQPPKAGDSAYLYDDPHASAPGLLGGDPKDEADMIPRSPSLFTTGPDLASIGGVWSGSTAGIDDPADHLSGFDARSTTDTHSITTAQYDLMIQDELEHTWILNLSMRFRDHSNREKFFVTYRENGTWRRVTISLDYRNPEPDSLERDLCRVKSQREKNAKIYDAIRESLAEIQFYDTVTNLKLQTTDGQLHVHVVEDGNEIIRYPSVNLVRHLRCKRIKERDVIFQSHMSGFVYKVAVGSKLLIKKEIPSPDTIEEFLYEINALSRLQFSDNVIDFYGLVVDDDDKHIKGLLISYADQGALIDVIYDNCKEGDYGLPWTTREKWARQVVRGLADVHESGFVQGDFTLSNIVIDGHGDAKIIDINRRGCPVGWEPPELTPLIESSQRISLYIGVKSDLYQLGMVLWSLAMEEDEPECQGRPLILGPEISVPDWYRRMVEICLCDDPRMRVQASSLLQMFPAPNNMADLVAGQPAVTVDDGFALREYLVDGYNDNGHPHIKAIPLPNEHSYAGRTYVDNSSIGYEPYYHPRGRSPPSPLPSDFDRHDSSPRRRNDVYRPSSIGVPPSYSDVGALGVPDPGASSQLHTPIPLAATQQIPDAGATFGRGGSTETNPFSMKLEEHAAMKSRGSGTGADKQPEQPKLQPVRMSPAPMGAGESESQQRGSQMAQDSRRGREQESPQENASEGDEQADAGGVRVSDPMGSDPKLPLLDPATNSGGVSLQGIDGVPTTYLHHRTLDSLPEEPRKSAVNLNGVGMAEDSQKAPVRIVEETNTESERAGMTAPVPRMIMPETTVPTKSMTSKKATSDPVIRSDPSLDHGCARAASDGGGAMIASPLPRLDESCGGAHRGTLAAFKMPEFLLAGVGHHIASLDEDVLLREHGRLEEELGMMGSPETVPTTFMVPTDAKR